MAWFTEGFDTADLTEAKALLDVLPRRSRLNGRFTAPRASAGEVLNDALGSI